MHQSLRLSRHLSRRSRGRCLLVAAGLSACLVGSAGPVLALIPVGTVGGSAFDVELVGDLAYVAGGGLRVFDISDPGAPVKIGAIDMVARDVTVAGDFAYVVGGVSLKVVDVTDPTSPEKIGSLDITGYTGEVEVVGNLAYAAGKWGLTVIDVSNPRAPVRLGRYRNWSGGRSLFGVYDIEVVGTIVYIAYSDRGFRVVDASNPNSLVELSVFSYWNDIAWAVDVVGELVYVPGRGVFDISNPASPVRIGNLGGSFSDVAVIGDLAYMSFGRGELVVVDVSDGTAKERLGSLAIPLDPSMLFAADIELMGDFAYVATGRYGMQVVDVSKPGFPAEISCDSRSLPPCYSSFVDGAREITVAGSIAYVAASGGLYVFDISDPTSRVEIGAFQTSREAYGVAVAGDFAYLGHQECIDPGPSSCMEARVVLSVIDVSNPTAPVELGALEMQASDLSQDIEIVGELAYVAGGYSGLRMIDISNPASPVEIGAPVMPHEAATDVEVVGHFAYVAASGGLYVFDISDPAAPVWIDAVAPRARDVEVVGEFAYVLGSEGWEESWLRVIDVSDPVALVEVGSISVRGRATEIEVLGDRAYAIVEGRVVVIDVSNPAEPVELGGFFVGSYDMDVAVAGDLAYVIDYRLRIIDFGPEYAGEIPIDVDIKPGSDPNAINPTTEGVIPIAILGSASFDAANVDAASLGFGPDGSAAAHDLSDPAEFEDHLEDVNGDGFVDLVAHFRTEETGIVFGTLVACLSGESRDGKSFSGCDALRTVPDMDGDKLLDAEEARLGTNALSRDTDRDGFTDGDEVLVMRTDPLDARDPAPVRARRGRGPRRR